MRNRSAIHSTVMTAKSEANINMHFMGICFLVRVLYETGRGNVIMHNDVLCIRTIRLCYRSVNISRNVLNIVVHTQLHVRCRF